MFTQNVNLPTWGQFESNNLKKNGFLCMIDEPYIFGLMTLKYQILIFKNEKAKFIYLSHHFFILEDLVKNWKMSILAFFKQ